MESLPNDVIRCISALLSPYIRSKLCQVNKQLYAVIMADLSDAKRKHEREWRYLYPIHDYHMFVSSALSLDRRYLVYGFIDIDLAKLIWRCSKKPRIKQLYDIFFNAAKRGNSEWISFLCFHANQYAGRLALRHNRAMLRGAIAGGHAQTVRELIRSRCVSLTSSDVRYAYTCNRVCIIDVLREYGFCSSLKLIDAACMHHCADIIYYEYTNCHEQYWWRDVRYSIVDVAICKNHILLLRAMIDSGYKLSVWQLHCAKKYCHDEIKQLIMGML